MPLRPVRQDRINTAKAFGLQNVDEAAVACREEGLPFWAACALLEKESGGANVWGGADASPFAQLYRLQVPVNKDTFTVFYAAVRSGAVPTGVGPCQITYSGPLRNGERDGGYFRIMLFEGLRPWDPLDNMRFGFATLWGHYTKNGRSWIKAGRLYNGSETYGRDLLAKCEEWHDRLNVAGPVNL